MSAPALHVGRPAVRIRGTTYPILLPRLRDPRLHLAAVIVSLQVLGQVAFDFTLSIAQILISLLTCAAIEVVIAFRRQHVILWPASALLTGNGVAFVLRVPGTEHGDWWSLHGWWIYAGTAAVALLSKYLIRFDGRHVFNPSNVGLVLCFLLLGPERADPLALWWGPLTPWMVLALAIIVAGGLAILGRLELLSIAVAFWVAFAAGLAVLALSGHEMTARWHLGAMTGFEFWRVLVLSPEILVFLFFMISDPRTIPTSPTGRRVYAVAVALVAVLLIAPFTTEFATKVAVLGALTIVCAARPVLLLVQRSRGHGTATAFVPRSRLGVGAAAVGGVAAFAGALVLAGIPARPSTAVALAADVEATELPEITVAASDGVATTIDDSLARTIARQVVSALAAETDALRAGDRERATSAATGAQLQELWQIIDVRSASSVVRVPRVERMTLALQAGLGQGPPRVVATVAGTELLETWAGSPRALSSTEGPRPFEWTLELELSGGRYLVAETHGRDAALPEPTAEALAAAARATGLGAIELTDVAAEVGLRFRHGAFRSGVSSDYVAMMGGGVCWLDVDGDGWLDLYAVNSHAETDAAGYARAGGLPRNGLFRNERGRFVDVSRGSGADLAMRGNGCVAGDFDGDGRTDLYVTSGTYNVATDGYDALLLNDGDGTFTEVAQQAGVSVPGWHAGAAIGDVNEDGRPDLFVAGYTDVNAPIPGSEAGFPTDHQAVRDRLFLNLGPGPTARVRFREVAQAAGIERSRPDHGLGAMFSDFDGDGRLDLYVANDADPNRLYVNVPWPGGAASDPLGLGFRLDDRARALAVADPNAGMGIAAADYDGDARIDLLVTNSHRQLHAVHRNGGLGQPFVDDRPAFAPAFDTRLAGWGASWGDLDLDGDLDLVYANGGIPIRGLLRDAEPVRVLGSRMAQNDRRLVADATRLVGLDGLPTVVGRGLATADFDNDGDLDVAVGSIGGRLMLLRNSGSTGNWLQVRTRSFAPGTQVSALLSDGRRLVGEVRAGSSYLSSEDPRVHLGLGAATSVVELEVRHPDGRTTTLRDVAANRIVTIG